MKRILIYSHDTYGLGNIRRMLAIAESIRAQCEDTSILLLSGSPMIHAFRLVPGIDYIKLPCLGRQDSECYAPKSLRIAKKRILKLRENLILSTVLNFEPDLILIDKKPLGVDNELAPTFDQLRSLKKKPKLLLILRDILDAPEKTIPVWTKNRYHDVVRDVYDRVLVLGSSDVFNTVEEYSFPTTTARKTFFCGYTNKPDPQRSPSAVRKELGIDDSRLLLVTAGGGEDGARMIRTALQAVEQFGTQLTDHCLMFLGPEMPESEAQRLRSWASGLASVTILSFSNDFMSYLGAADAVVAMGGYNTVTEILSLAVPAVIVPRVEPVSEQQIRATCLQRLGLVQAVAPDELTPARLARAVSDAMAGSLYGARNRQRLNLSALQHVVRHVEALLGKQRENTRPLAFYSNKPNGADRLRLAERISEAVVDEPMPLAGSTA